MTLKADAEFKSVVRRMYGIAEAFYNNDLQTNILSVYNRLNEREQYIFLKGLIPYIFDVERPAKKVREQVDMEYDEYNIEAINAIEMIKLKTWVVKCIMVFGSTVIILITSYILFTALLPNDKLGQLSKLFEFMSIVFID